MQVRTLACGSRAKGLANTQTPTHTHPKFLVVTRAGSAESCRRAGHVPMEAEESTKPALGYGFWGIYSKDVVRWPRWAVGVQVVGVAKEGFERHERPFDDFFR